MSTRKKYTQEFKEDAIRLVLEQGYKQTEAARNLGIDRSMLARWIKESQSDEGEAFRGNGKLTAEGEELRRLREENRRLRMEREILKKRRPSSRESRAEISVHRPGEEGLSGEDALPSIGREPQRFL
jgi:transposase